MSLLRRRQFLQCFLGTAIVAAIPTVIDAQSGSTFNDAEKMLSMNMVDLEDQLVKGLRLTTASQKQYIGTILQAVRQERIPRSMVNVVFVWARQKNPKYPFPYFQIAIRTLAKRRGVAL